MIAFRQILCPVDFSEFSRHALDHAVAISQWYGGTVTALHVLQPIPLADPLMGPLTVYTPQDRQRALGDLGGFVHQEAGATPVATVVLEGSAVSTIIEHANALHADLIVMGTHGRRGFEHLMMGSVTERVLRKAPCPVLTVPRRMPDAVPAGPVILRRVLCAVDFSPASLQALAYAASLASEAKAELTVMHVVEPAPIHEPVMMGGASGVANADEAARQASLARIREIAPRNIRVTEAVTTGKPYREILNRAAADRTDLLVIGVHSAVAERFHLGSTTNHVIREAACAVLSLRG